MHDMVNPKRKNAKKTKCHPRRWLALAFLGFLLLTGIGLYIALRPASIIDPQYPSARLVYTIGADQKRFSINLQTHEFDHIDESPPEYKTPRLSPDGKWRVLWQPAEGQNEWKLILESVASDVPARVLGQFFHVIRYPVWSADSQWIAFSAAAGESDPTAVSWMYLYQELWLMKIETGELKRLTNDLVAQFSPSFSPDGARLVYVSNECGSVSLCLFIMDLAAGESELVLHDKEAMVGEPSLVWPRAAAPAWSPDGGWIALVSYIPSDNYSIRLIRPDGSEAHIVEGYGPYAADPEWQLE